MTTSLLPRRSFVALLMLLFAAALPLLAGGKAETHHYRGKITGLFCSACAEKVKASLKKMEGVTKIKIVKSDEQGVQEIQLEASVLNLNKEQAIKALGEDAKTFTLLSFERLD